MEHLRKIALVLTFACFLAACGSGDAEDAVVEETDTAATADNDATDEAETDDAKTETVEAEEAATASTVTGDVEVYLVDALDDDNNYCIDISGGKADQVEGTEDLQAHTCYSYTGEIAADQVFAVEEIAAGTLFMTYFDVCATAASASAGASIGLTACDESNDLQAFTASNGDQFTLSLSSDSSLCVTASTESRAGGSDIHNIRDLTLDACSDDSAAYQTWSYRDGI